ncbi:MAG: thioredoxin-disulfide reductase, partial [Candidatus Omnitrophota bacterium]|nr:thioredoxin-disulfide reductase [Candidatus Omnitrophota bacterium]
MREETYDTIIIGGGPAGLTAGLYTQRARMNALLIEKGFPGGQVLLTDRIENYPGFPEGITGLELVERMKEQTRRIGLEIVKDEITGIKLREDEKTGKTFYLASAAGREFAAMSVIIATGAVWKSLGVQGEDEFRGKGVSYCATCDAPFFKNRKIVIVGGGDKAAEEAIYLTKFANEIILIHRRNRLRAAKILQDALGKSNKIKLCLDSIVTSINGAQTVENVKVENVKDKSERQISCQGVFIFVGVAPNSFLVRDKTKLDEKGYIITGDDMRTSTEGIFACGDVRKKTL